MISKEELQKIRHLQPFAKLKFHGDSRDATLAARYHNLIQQHADDLLDAAELAVRYSEDIARLQLQFDELNQEVNILLDENSEDTL